MCCSSYSARGVVMILCLVFKMKISVVLLVLNPLTPKTDEHLNSPYKITLESNFKVTKIRKMITDY